MALTAPPKPPAGASFDAVLAPGSARRRWRSRRQDRTSPNYDAALLEVVERSLIAAAGRQPVGFRERLEGTLDHLLAIQTPRLGAAAQALGVSARTLQRRLAGEGVTFQERLRARRRQIVEDGSRERRRPSFSRLAERTGYSDASALSQFMRTHGGR